MELTIDILPQDEGRRAVDVLQTRLGVSRTLAKRVRLYGSLLRNGIPMRMIETVHAGDRLLVLLEAPVTPPFPAGPHDAGASPALLWEAFQAEGGRILHLDAHLCVLEKPSSWLTHPTHRDRKAVSTVVAERSGAGRVHPVNRLDRGTSGLLIVALDPYAHHALAEQAQSGRSVREYVGLVHGVPQPAMGRIDAAIGVDPTNPVRRTVLADGKPAITDYATEWTHSLATPFGAATLSAVRFRLSTGRTHQIRVHCAFFGNPLVGDPLYGIACGRPADAALDARDVLDGRIARQALHASRIAFHHPIGATWMMFESPLPPDMAGVSEGNRF
jgi:23S rRNA pseudouridine1911/1915/1917 synthase